MTRRLERLKGARTAIVHDWFQGYHGSERVVEVIRGGLAEATGVAPHIFTFHAAHELLPPELSRAIVRESRLAKLPGVRQRGHDPGRWRYLLPYMPGWFERLDLRDYDIVISSSHACAANVRARPGATHVCYCHTPMRYAWTPETDRGRVGGAKALALGLLARRLRQIDRVASRRPDAYVANSEAVRDRIKRFYGREAVVIHPPVETEELDPLTPKDPDLYLWVHRLVTYKRPELVAEAFRGLPLRLVMVGVGPLEARLRAMLPSNVELRGWLPRAELGRLYAAAAGFVHVGEEDFGMTMVEALAAGTPVIALNRGGARDIVRDGIDGVLVDRPEVGAVRGAVRASVAMNWERSALAARAAEFTSEKFVDRLCGLLQELRSPGAGLSEREARP